MHMTNSLSFLLPANSFRWIHCSAPRHWYRQQQLTFLISSHYRHHI